MKAFGVTYATQINKAADAFTTDAAMLQCFIDLKGDADNIAGITEKAKDYARKYAQDRLAGDARNDMGANWPEANLMAAAWWFQGLVEQYGDEWTAVKAYFEMSPRGEGKMHHIYNVLYPKYLRLWGGVS